MESPFRGPAKEQGMSDLRVIETMRCENRAIVRLDRHLARLQRTCSTLDFAFDGDKVLAELQKIGGGPKRVRLTIGKAGLPELKIADITPNPPFWRVMVSSQRLDPADPWLRMKTTQRQLYDQQRADMPAGIDDILFENSLGALCEGAITNVFVNFGGGLLTPALVCGLLPGILREEMLELDQCCEAELLASDLRFATEIFVGNSLRGLIPVVMV